MPIETTPTDLTNRLIVSTPELANHGYRIIEWLHESEETRDMTNVEWIAILSTAIFNLGFDIAASERKSMHYKVMDRLGNKKEANKIINGTFKEIGV